MAGYKRYRKDSPVSYALGITLTFELLRFQPDKVTRVYIHSGMKEGETLDKLRSLCRDAGIEMVQTDKIFHVLSQKENCYVIGEFTKYEGQLEKTTSHIVLVNQMAIIRPAVDAFDPKVVRASMGAIFSTNFVYFEDFDEYQAQFGERELYPFMLDAKKSLHEIRPQGTFSLLFGNEATGLPDRFAQIGTSVIIPHSNRIDSLNLPIAASIAMYETTKQQFES